MHLATGSDRAQLGLKDGAERAHFFRAENALLILPVNCGVKTVRGKAVFPIGTKVAAHNGSLSAEFAFDGLHRVLKVRTPCAIGIGRVPRGRKRSLLPAERSIFQLTAKQNDRVRQIVRRV